MLLAQVQLGTSLTDIVDASLTPSPGLVKITSIWFCNVTAADRLLTIRVGAGTLTTANSLYEINPLPASDTWIVKNSDEMVAAVNAGMKLQGKTDSANGITVTVFGIKKP